jgi:hypothetical protein
MANLTSFEMFRIQFTGVIYALAYFTAHNSFLGLRWSGWIKWTILIFTVAAWIGRWSRYWVIIGAVLYLIVLFFYWRVKRQGYIRFLAARKQPSQEAGYYLADNRKVKALATGAFSVSRHQAYVLQKTAQYWRVPVGDHAIMVEHEPGKFLYQFIQAGALQRVESGFLIFGRRPQEALAVTFLTTWGPEFGDTSPRQLMAGTNHTPAKLEQTIYLTFEDTADRRLVRQNLMRDMGKPLHKPA